MADSFGMPQIHHYLKQMKLKVAHSNPEQNMLELAFQGEHGQWRMVISIQQQDNARKLLLIVPHFGTLTTEKRLDCLEALMTINYRIALGKFGLDPDDGEIRLEESIPLATSGISFEQFQLAMGAIMQTVSIYHGLFSIIIHEDMDAQDALKTCEQAFFQDTKQTSDATPIAYLPPPADTHNADEQAELDVNEILAEVARIFEKSKE